MKTQNQTRWHLVENLKNNHNFCPSLIFEAWEFPFKILLAFLANIRHWWNRLIVKNTLAYFGIELISPASAIRLLHTSLIFEAWNFTLKLLLTFPANIRHW
jgi:hypothetical protein